MKDNLLLEQLPRRPFSVRIAQLLRYWSASIQLLALLLDVTFTQRGMSPKLSVLPGTELDPLA